MTLFETPSGPLRGPLRKRESHLWSRDAHDWYVEPEWCSARLFELEHFRGVVWDPAAGLGRIVEAARAAGLEAFGSDVVDRGCPGSFWVADFMNLAVTTDNIVSNPPFSIAEKFAARALERARDRVALLLPANWVQGDKRSRWMQTTPLERVLFLTPRPSILPGAVVAAGGKPGNGTTDYAWFLWRRSYGGEPSIGWLRRDAA